MDSKLIIISGPTASGKSRLAQEAYDYFRDFSIVNADSMQVYKDLPILTAHPNDLNTNPSNYNLYSILSYDQSFSVSSWFKIAEDKIKGLWASGKIPLIVGGTGLYIKTLLYGLSNLPDISPEVRSQVNNLFVEIGTEEFYKLLQSKDPVSSARIHNNDSYRMTRAMEVFEQTGKSITSFYKLRSSHKSSLYNYLHINISPLRQVLYESCNKRFLEMIAGGVLDEVSALRIKPNSATSLLTKALGYSSLGAYLDKKISLEEAIDKGQVQTRQYAKRQVTWFKNQAPEATTLEFESYSEINNKTLSLIKQFLGR
jgi:tRNA dimethylallyltransferase